MATDNDPKLKVRAYALAAQFDSQPIKWRVDPDGAFVLILVDGRKMKFDHEPVFTPLPPMEDSFLLTEQEKETMHAMEDIKPKSKKKKE